jgi:hypothetical protein
MIGFVNYIFDTPPSSLMDSSVSPKMKTTKEKKVGHLL